MSIVCHNDRSEIESISKAWDRLAIKGLFFVPPFSEVRLHLEAPDAKFKLIVATEDDEIQAIACFIYFKTNKTVEIATRRLFALPVQAVGLHGSCIVGDASEEIIRAFLHEIRRDNDYDLMIFGHVFRDGPLYQAIQGLRAPLLKWNPTRRHVSWWLIELPRSFDEYLETLRPSARTHILRDVRRFEKKSPRFRVFTEVPDVPAFLEDAERISRLTYQWAFGFGICDDEQTRLRLRRLATTKNLRGYLLYINDQPCAFGWGTLAYGRFLFEQMGYDPRYKELSPGTSLMMKMIRDLIDDQQCQIFDFKWGGSGGYKSRFATTHRIAAPIEMARISAPYSWLLMSVDRATNLIKQLLGLLIENSFVEGRLRPVLRRFGKGTF